MATIAINIAFILQLYTDKSDLRVGIKILQNDIVYILNDPYIHSKQMAINRWFEIILKSAYQKKKK